MASEFSSSLLAVAALARQRRGLRERLSDFAVPAFGRTLAVVGFGLVGGSLLAFASSNGATDAVPHVQITQVGPVSSASASPSPTSAPSIANAGPFPAVGSFRRQTDNCGMPATLTDGFSIQVSNGRITLTQPSTGAITTGTVQPSGEFSMTGANRTYSGTVTGKSAQGTHQFTNNGCTETYTFMLAIQGNLIPVATTTLPPLATNTLNPTAFRCTGEVTKFYDNWNVAAVSNGATPPTFSTNGKPYCLVSIATYHWNNGGGVAPGSIALVGSGGTLGPWKTTGEAGQGGALNVAWIANPPPPIVVNGNYTCWDSDPSSWSSNSDSGGQGFCRVWLQTATQIAETSPTTAPAATGGASPAPSGSLVPGVGGGIVRGGGVPIPGGAAGGLVIGLGLLLTGVAVSIRKVCDCTRQQTNFDKAVMRLQNAKDMIEFYKAELAAIASALAEWEKYRRDLFYALVWEFPAVKKQINERMAEWQAYIRALQDRIKFLQSLLGPLGVAHRDRYDTRPHPGWAEVAPGLYANSEQAANEARTSVAVAELLKGGMTSLPGGGIGYASAITLCQMAIQNANAKIAELAALLAKVAAEQKKAQAELDKADAKIAELKDQQHQDEVNLNLEEKSLPGLEQLVKDCAAALKACMGPPRATPPCPDGPEVYEYDVVDRSAVDTSPPSGGGVNLPTVPAGPPDLGSDGVGGAGTVSKPRATGDALGTPKGDAVALLDTDQKNKIGTLVKERDRVRADIKDLQKKPVLTTEDRTKLEDLEQREHSLSQEISDTIVTSHNANVDKIKKERAEKDKQTTVELDKNDVEKVNRLETQRKKLEGEIAELEKTQTAGPPTEADRTTLSTKRQELYELDLKIHDAKATAVKNAKVTVTIPPGLDPADIEKIRSIEREGGKLDLEIADLQQKESAGALSETQRTRLSLARQERAEIPGRMNDAYTKAKENAEKREADKAKTSQGKTDEKAPVKPPERGGVTRAPAGQKPPELLPEDQARLAATQREIDRMVRRLLNFWERSKKGPLTTEDATALAELQKKYRDTLVNAGKDYQASTKRAQERPPVTEPTPRTPTDGATEREKIKTRLDQLSRDPDRLTATQLKEYTSLRGRETELDAEIAKTFASATAMTRPSPEAEKAANVALGKIEALRTEGQTLRDRANELDALKTRSGDQETELSMLKQRLLTELPAEIAAIERELLARYPELRETGTERAAPIEPATPPPTTASRLAEVRLPASLPKTAALEIAIDQLIGKLGSPAVQRGLDEVASEIGTSEIDPIDWFFRLILSVSYVKEAQHYLEIAAGALQALARTGTDPTLATAWGLTTDEAQKTLARLSGELAVQLGSKRVDDLENRISQTRGDHSIKVFFDSEGRVVTMDPPRQPLSTSDAVRFILETGALLSQLRALRAVATSELAKGLDRLIARLEDIHQNVYDDAYDRLRKGLTDAIAAHDEPTTAALRNELRTLYEAEFMKDHAGQSADERKSALQTELKKRDDELANTLRLTHQRFDGKDLSDSELASELTDVLRTVAIRQARRDAVEDLLLAGSPTTRAGVFTSLDKLANGDWRFSDMQAAGSADAINSPANLGKYYKRNGYAQAYLSRESSPLDKTIAKFQLEHANARLRQLVIEDPTLTTEQKFTKWEEYRKNSAAYWTAVGAPQGIFALPGYSTFAIGKEFGEYGKELGAKLTFDDLPTMFATLVNPDEKDVQGVMRVLGDLFSEDLRRSWSLYLSYLDTDTMDRGLTQALRQIFSGGEHGTDTVLAKLTREFEAESPLGQAFRTAGRMTPEDLLREHPTRYRLLESKGWISGGQYRVPDDYRYDPLKVGDVESKRTRLDDAINTREMLKLLFTVVIPGGVAARATRGLEITNVFARIAIETLLFTSSSKAAQVVIDPTRFVGKTSEQAMTELLKETGKEYVINLFTMGVLAGMSAGAARVERALVGEARTAEQILAGSWQTAVRNATSGELGRALLTTGVEFTLEVGALAALNSATSHQPFGDEYVINLVYLIEGRTAAIAKGLLGEVQTQAPRRPASAEPDARRWESVLRDKGGLGTLEAAISSNDSKTIADIVNASGGWKEMAKSFERAHPDTAAALTKWRNESVAQEVERLFGVTVTGGSGKMANDIDVSAKGIVEITNPETGKLERMGPGQRATLAKRWLTKTFGTWELGFDMAVFLDPTLMHVYDSISDPAARADVIRRLSDLSFGFVLQYLETVSPQTRARLIRELRLDPASLPRAPGHVDLDQAYAEIDRAMFELEALGSKPNLTRAEQARYGELVVDIVRRQMEANFHTPDAYVPPGAVKWTVTVKEALWDPLGPGSASARDLMKALKTQELDIGQAKADLARLPEGPEKEAWRKHIEGLEAEQMRTASQLARERQRYEALFTIDEIVQSMLGDIAFFEHIIHVEAEKAEAERGVIRSAVEREGFVGEAARAETDRRVEARSIERAANRYELSKYADRVLELAQKAGLDPFTSPYGQRWLPIRKYQSVAKQVYKTHDPSTRLSVDEAGQLRSYVLALRDLEIEALRSLDRFRRARVEPPWAPRDERARTAETSSDRPDRLGPADSDTREIKLDDTRRFDADWARERPARGEGSHSLGTERAWLNLANIGAAEREMRLIIEGDEMYRGREAQALEFYWKQYVENLAEVRTALATEGPNYWEHFEAPNEVSFLKARLEEWTRTGRPLVPLEGYISRLGGRPDALAAERVAKTAPLTLELVDADGAKTAVLEVPDLPGEDGGKTAVLPIPELPGDERDPTRLAEAAARIGHRIQAVIPREGVIAVVGDDLGTFLPGIRNLKPVRGYLDVLVHGGTKGFYVLRDGGWLYLTPAGLARILRTAGYAGQPIRLISCRTGVLDVTVTGDLSAAAEGLAKALHATVYAPNRTIWLGRDGRLYISGRDPSEWTQSPPSGVWEKFDEARVRRP